MLCILTSKCMLADAFTWSKTWNKFENHKKVLALHELPVRMMDKVLFSWFLKVFHHFWTCERMCKHPFAGRNTWHYRNVVELTISNWGVGVFLRWPNLILTKTNSGNKNAWNQKIENPPKESLFELFQNFWISKQMI